MRPILFLAPLLSLTTPLWAADEHARPGQPTKDAVECKRYPTGWERHSGFGARRAVGDAPMFVSRLGGVQYGSEREAYPAEKATVVPADHGNHILVLEDGSVRVFDYKSRNTSPGVPIGPRDSAGISPDGRYFYIQTPLGLTLRNSTDGSIAGDFPGLDANMAKLSFSRDGSKFTVTVPGSHSIVYPVGPGNGERVTLSTGAGVRSGSVSADGRFAAATTADSVNLLRLPNTTVPVSLPKSTYHRVALSPTGDFLIAVPEKGRPSLVDTGTGQVVHTLAVDAPAKVQFSRDGKSLLLHNEKQLELYDLGKRASVKAWESESGIAGAEIFANGSGVLFAEKGGRVEVWHPLSGKRERQFSVGGPVHSAKASLDGTWMAVHAGGDQFVYGPEGYVRKAPLRNSGAEFKFSADNKTLFTQTQEQSWLAMDLSSACSFLSPKLLDVEVDAATLAKAKEDCANSRNIETSQPLWQMDELSGTDAALALLKIQRDSVAPEFYLGVLEAILKSDFPEKHPDLVVAALMTVMGYSPAVYEKLAQDHPKIRKLKVSSKPFTCWSGRVEAALHSPLWGTRGGRLGYSATLADWDDLLAFGPLLVDAPDSVSDAVASSLAESASRSANFNQVFISKLYYLSEDVIRMRMGKGPRKLTDLTLLREPERLRPLILGVEAIDGKTQPSPFGFHAKELPEIPLPPKDKAISDRYFTREAAWEHGGQRYSAAISVGLHPDAQVTVGNRAALPHQDLWADGKLVGALVVGSNLATERAKIVDWNVNYFQNAGFEFGPKMPVVDVSKWVSEKVSSGEIDYFIREAHSAGDEKNLGKFPVDGFRQKATRRTEDGKIEEFHLVWPQSEFPQSKHLSNAEFGEAVRKRKTPLVHVNGSCWSCDKAWSAMEAARSPLLIELPSITPVYGVSNVTHAQMVLLDGVRNGSTYADMRKRMDADPIVRAYGKNKFILPNEPEYQKRILDRIPYPVSSKVVVIDGRGEVVNID